MGVSSPALFQLRSHSFPQSSFCRSPVRPSILPECVCVRFCPHTCLCVGTSTATKHCHRSWRFWSTWSPRRSWTRQAECTRFTKPVVEVVVRVVGAAHVEMDGLGWLARTRAGLFADEAKQGPHSLTDCSAQLSSVVVRPTSHHVVVQSTDMTLHDDYYC